MTEEKAYYEKDNIRITSKWVVIGRKTFSMPNITSVDMRKAPKTDLKYTVALLLFFGIIGAVYGLSDGNIWLVVFSVLYVAGSAAWVIFFKPKKYTVHIIGGDGETITLESYKERIQEIADAISNAMAKED